MWVDRYGRMLSLTFSGPPPAPPAGVDRTPAEMAAQFTRLCVEAAADPAAEGLTAAPYASGGGRNPLVLDIWRGEGLVLSRTEGFFAAPNAQCNAVFYVNTLPERQAVVDAVSAALGAQPSNAAQATRRNGRPNRNYVPQWSIGAARVVVAHVGRGTGYMPGDRVHLSIRTR